jgi:hypothetical protein
MRPVGRLVVCQGLAGLTEGDLSVVILRSYAKYIDKLKDILRSHPLVTQPRCAVRLKHKLEVSLADLAVL